MKPAAPLLPLLLTAAGCAVVGCTVAAGLADPPVAQLARWRTAAPETIAAEPVVGPCPRSNPACLRLHVLRAEACLGRALASRAPGAACPASRAAPLLDCATENYSAALAAPAAPDAPTLRNGLAQSLLCRAELDPSETATHRALAAAEAARGAPPDLSALHTAHAALLLARIGPAAERRAAASRALDLSKSTPNEHRARLRADAEALLRRLPLEGEATR